MSGSYELKAARQRARKLLQATGQLSDRAQATSSIALTSGSVGIGNMTVPEYAKWRMENKDSSTLLHLPTPSEFQEQRDQSVRRLLGRSNISLPSTPSFSIQGPATSQFLRCRHCKKVFPLNRLGIDTARKRLCKHEKECCKLQCDFCCQVFKTPLQRRGHETICSQNAKNRCEFCALRIATKAEKQSHEATCDKNPALWCDWCGMQFPHQALRDRHQTRCPRNPKRTCRFCHGYFTSRNEAIVHQVFCRENPKSQAELGKCVACCEKLQCIRFPCGQHIFCAKCLFDMASMAIKDRTMIPLRCCKQKVEPGDKVDLAIGQLLPEVGRQKYQEAMLLKASQNVMYCPQPDCGALIVLDHIVQAKVDDGPIGCPKCQQALCHECKSEWHTGMTCHQYQFLTAKSVDAITKYCRQMNYMRCGDCGHVIEKKAGCNHMTCLCGNNFCYVCGSKWGDCRCQIVSQHHALRHNRLQQDASFVCSFCRQPYPSTEELRVHLLVCRAALDQQGGAFQCANCLENLQSGELLRKHRRFCQAAMKQMFACPECRLQFDDQATLRRHRRICGQDTLC
mmetsp:Transcript_122336/g.237984  ORF Transcript_122336/g.237984 Transcript_122336/m.237984 type:complete len:567 (-) Transcript_122336:70-1770(-)